MPPAAPLLPFTHAIDGDFMNVATQQTVQPILDSVAQKVVENVAISSLQLGEYVKFSGRDWLPKGRHVSDLTAGYQSPPKVSPSLYPHTNAKCGRLIRTGRTRSCDTPRRRRTSPKRRDLRGHSRFPHLITIRLMPAKDCGEKPTAADCKGHEHEHEAARKKRLKTQRSDRKGADSEDDETEEEDALSSASDSDVEDREYSIDFGAITARLGGAASTHRRSVVSSFVPPPTEQWTPPVNPKSAQDAESIRRSVRRNLLFANIPEDTLQVLVDAMKYVAVDAGVDVVTQGDVGGDRFFILDSGACDVLVHDRVVGEVCATSPRNFFGELALLYDSPRAATVRAKTPVECWSLDRVTFKRVLMATTMQQRALYLDFLGQVPIFSTLSSYEKMTVADALRVQFVESGDTILTEGSRGDDFYIIADGEVKCTRGGEEVSARLGAGDFFGELALIHDDVRQATVTAMRKTKLLVLDRATFKRLLGPMQEHLRKRADLYELYMNAPRVIEQS